MDRETLRAICTDLLGETPPTRLVKRANALLVQSRPKITLKGPQESARNYICCVLAIQDLQDAMGFDDPDTSKPPVPQGQLKKLLHMFSNQLLDNDVGDDASPQQSPSKRSPVKRKRNELEFIESATKSRRSRNKDPADEFKLFASLAQTLALNDEVLKAMATAQAKYKEHVTDKWGLAMAIAFLVIHRAAPEKGTGLERLILQTAGCASAEQRLNEWLQWAQNILNGQRLVGEIAVVPETVKEFHGGTGGWTFELESPNWWENDASFQDQVNKKDT